MQTKLIRATGSVVRDVRTGHPSPPDAAPVTPTVEMPMMRRLIAPTVVAADDGTAAWTLDRIMEHAGKLIRFEQRYGLVVFLSAHLGVEWSEPSGPTAAGRFAAESVPMVVCAMAALYMLTHHAGTAGRTAVAALPQRPIH